MAASLKPRSANTAAALSSSRARVIACVSARDRLGTADSIDIQGVSEYTVYLSEGVAVSVEELRMSYGEVTAVDGVSFTVATGEIVAILGPNGAGKTTTVEILE